MGKAFALALLALLGTGAWSYFCYRVGGFAENKRTIRAGGLGDQGVTLLKEAREIFTEQVDPSSLITRSGLSYDMLTEDTTKKVSAWLQAFNKWRGKIR